jgi:hypothetical protein
VGVEAGQEEVVGTGRGEGWVKGRVVVEVLVMVEMVALVKVVVEVVG